MQVRLDREPAQLALSSGDNAYMLCSTAFRCSKKIPAEPCCNCMEQKNRYERHVTDVFHALLFKVSIGRGR